MQKKLSKVQDSILILCALQAYLTEQIKCLNKVKNKTESTLYSIILSQIIITSCSYMEEWEYLGSLSVEDSRIIKLRKIVKPAVKRIYQWKDIKDFRNSVLAHNLRIRKHNNINALYNIASKLNVPRSFYDFQLLVGCIYVTKNVMLKIFPKEYNDMVKNTKEIKHPEPVDEIKSKKEYKQIFDSIINQVKVNGENSSKS